MRSSLFSVLLVLLLGVGPSMAQSVEGQGADRTVSMDFSGVDLPVFVKFMSELTGRNYIIDDKVKGKVTVLSPRRMSVEEAARVFDSVLAVHGFMAVPAGEVTKIVPTRDSPVTGLRTVVSGLGEAGSDDEVVTQVVQLRYAKADTVQKLLAPMVSKSGLVSSYGPSDVVIVTDTQANIRRLLTVLRQVDTRDTEHQTMVLPLKHAAADKVAAKLLKILDVGPAGGQAQAGATRPLLNIQADERTNALIVLGEAQYLERVRELATELDRPGAREQAGVQVVRLQHADATELAGVLTGLASRKGESAGPGRAEAGKDAQPLPARPVLAGDVTVIPDKATNSLVITASPDDTAKILDIIRSLDKARRQVLVEALIMEVSSDVNVQMGTQFLGGFSSTLGPNGGVIGGFSNPSGTGIGLLNPSGAPGFGLGAASVPVTINGVTFTNLDALIAYGKSQNDFNIISTPQVMTLDNTEAALTVAENRPFQTSSNIGNNIDDFTINQFQYRDVGTILKITPQVNEGGVIKLKIYQEFSEIDQAATGQTSSLLPVTRKRTTDTTVLITEGQTVVLSGLIGKTSSRSESKVPGLGDVPLLGWLFKVKRETDRRTNLLIFITPRIVDGPRQAQDLYISKVKEFENIQFDASDRIEPRLMPLAPSEPR